MRHPGKWGPTEPLRSAVWTSILQLPWPGKQTILRRDFNCSTKTSFSFKSWLTRTLNELAAIKVIEDVRHCCHFLTPWFALSHPHLVDLWKCHCTRSTPHPSSPQGWHHPWQDTSSSLGWMLPPQSPKELLHFCSQDPLFMPARPVLCTRCTSEHRKTVPQVNGPSLT